MNAHCRKLPEQKASGAHDCVKDATGKKLLSLYVRIGMHAGRGMRHEDEWYCL